LKQLVRVVEAIYVVGRYSFFKHRYMGIRGKAEIKADLDEKERNI
jgi:hypothetical protein